MNITKQIAISVISLLALTSALTALCRGDVRTVALSSETAADAGVPFLDFGIPALNSNGQAAFIGTLSGAGVNESNNKGIWSEGAGLNLGLVAREGASAPGTDAGVVFGEFEFEQLVLNNQGETAFISAITGTGITADNGSGIWSEGGGSGLSLIARAGDAAPGLADGVRFQDFANRQIRLNDQGRVAFRSLITGPGIDGSNLDTVWSERSGGLALVARSAEPAPGTSMTFTSFNFSEPVLNNNGQTAFSGAVFVAPFQQFGVWKGDNANAVSVVALPASQAPGTEPSVAFDATGPPTINDHGQTAFRASVLGSGVNASNRDGIWSEAGGHGLTLIARSGESAPGTGAVHSGFNFPLINDRGDTVFQGIVNGPNVDVTNNAGIWKDSDNSDLELAVREGDTAPGTDPGVNFNFTFLTSNSVSLNDNGQVAFASALVGAGIDGTNDVGIWAEDIAGDLQLIARTGDLLEVNAGQPNSDLRTISSLGFSSSFTNTGNSDGRPSSFNDLGQLAFYAQFTDGSNGVFISNAVAVPEPSTMLFLTWLVGTLLIINRRRMSLST